MFIECFTYFYRGPLINLALSPASSESGFLPTLLRLSLSKIRVQFRRPREPASEQVFRRDQWAPCTHVRASQCDINIAIIIYVLSPHPRLAGMLKISLRGSPPSASLYLASVLRRAPSAGCGGASERCKSLSSRSPRNATSLSLIRRVVLACNYCGNALKCISCGSVYLLRT